MHTYQDDEGNVFVFIDWEAVYSVESDQDGVTLRLNDPNHPLAQDLS